MLIGNILREILALRSTSAAQPDSGVPPPQMAAPPSAPFARRKDAPAIIVISHSFTGHGAGIMLMMLLQRLVNVRGWQVRAHWPDLAMQDRQALAAIGVPMVDEIDFSQYDFALINSILPAPFAARMLIGHLPYLLWVHEGQAMFRLDTTIAEMTRTLLNARRLIFQTPHQAERIYGSFTHLMSPGQYQVINNALPPIPPLPEPLHPRREGIKRIICIGALNPLKNTPLLVAAAALLTDENFEIIFVGEVLESSLDPAHLDLLHNDKRIILAGFLEREQAMALLASADVLAHPSMDESQPLVLLEAARFNVPLVIANLAVYGYCWQDEVNCLMHDPHDAASLAKQLRRALAGEAPPPRIPPELYDTEVFFQRFDAVLEQMLSP